MYLQQRRFRNRPNWIEALGQFEAEPTALPSRSENHTDFAGLKCFDATLLGGGVGDTQIATHSRHSICEPYGRGWFGAARKLRPVGLVFVATIQRGDELEVDLVNLCGELLPLRCIDLVPKVKQSVLVPQVRAAD